MSKKLEGKLHWSQADRGHWCRDRQASGRRRSERGHHLHERRGRRARSSRRLNAPVESDRDSGGRRRCRRRQSRGR